MQHRQQEGRHLFIRTSADLLTLLDENENDFWKGENREEKDLMIVTLKMNDVMMMQRVHFNDDDGLSQL